MTKVEEVARAIACVEGDPSDWEWYVSDARAAIEAMRTPSAAMVDAGAENIIGPCDVRYVFHAMIDAALQEGA